MYRPSIKRAAILAAFFALAGQASGLPGSTRSAAAEPLQSTAASAGVRFTIIPEATEVRYKLRAQTIGQPPEDVICTTQAVAGEFVASPEGAILPEQSRFVVDQRTLGCNSPRATSLVQRTLETSVFPMSEFVLREAPGLPVPLPVGSELPFQFVGDQKVRDLTRPLAYEVVAAFSEQGIGGLAIGRTKMSEFNLKPPGLGPLLKVEDSLVVELAFQAAAADAGF